MFAPHDPYSHPEGSERQEDGYAILRERRLIEKLDQLQSQIEQFFSSCSHAVAISNKVQIRPWHGFHHHCLMNRLSSLRFILDLSTLNFWNEVEEG